MDSVFKLIVFIIGLVGNIYKGVQEYCFLDSIHHLVRSQLQLPTENFEEIKIYSVVNRVKRMTPGLYRVKHLVKASNFTVWIGYLYFHQALSINSAVTLFFVSQNSKY